MASTNITTFPGKVGISNANPTHTLSIGSNVFVDDTGLTVLGEISTTGTLSGDGSGLNNIQSSNVSDFASNVTRIGTLETDLDDNSSRISTVSTDLSDNSSRISTVSTDLSDNSSRISTVSTDLSDNSSRISTVSTDLSDNSSRISSVESGAHTFTGIKTFQDDLILESNLRVQGDLLVANTVNMTVSDPILELGSNNLNTGDIGLVMTRHGASQSNVAVFYDESVDVLKMGYTLGGANDTTITLENDPLSVSIQGTLEVDTANVNTMNVSAIEGLQTLSFSSDSTTVPPLQLTASSLNDGVGALRIDSVEPDVFLNDTDGGFSTVTFANNGVARAAFGRNSGDDFYITVRDPAANGGNWRNTTLVVDSSTGDVSMGYGLTAASVSGDGSGLTALNGDQVTTGTVAAARIDNLDASKITTGTITRPVDTSTVTIDDYLIHDGDTNTKVGFPANDTFTVTTANSERLRVDSSGNVGIGTASPTRALDIVLNSETGSSNTVGLVIQNISSDYTSIADGFGSRIQFTTNRGYDSAVTILKSADIKGYIYTGAGGAADYHALDLDVYGDNSSLNRGISILSKSATGGPADTIVHGNLGIGTTSPDQKLEVHGNILLGNNDVHSFIHGGAVVAVSADTDILIVADSNDTSGAAPAGDIIFGSGSAVDTNQNRDFTFAQAYPSNVPRNEHMRITGDGNVGIGTASPDTDLHIYGSTSQTNIFLGEDGSADKAGIIKYFQGDNSSNPGRLVFGNWGDDFSNGTTTMCIKKGGNVGIGTTSPVCELDVRGAINTGTYGAINGYMADRSLTIGDSSVNYGGGTGWNSNTAGLLMECLDNTEIAMHDAGTRVSSFVYYEGGSTNRFTIGRNMGWGAISTVAINGNVGIGTTSPGAKLDVVTSSSTPALYLRNSTNVAGCKLVMTDDSTSTQNCTLTYLHANGSSLGAGNRLHFSTTETTSVFSIEGTLMIGVDGKDNGAASYARRNLWIQSTYNGNTSQNYGWWIGTQNQTLASNDNDLYFAVVRNGTLTVPALIQDNTNNVQMNFTGQHRTFVKGVPIQQLEDKEGLIVSADQNDFIRMSGGVARGNEAITTNESLPIVSFSTKSNDKKCFGVISTTEDPENRVEVYGNFASNMHKELGDTRVYINSVGEGAVWVTDINGPLESGDYITTSNVAGYGMRQEDDILHNYTVAKITMDCDFNPRTQPKKIIKKELANVDYWIDYATSEIKQEEYETLPENEREIREDKYYKIYKREIQKTNPENDNFVHEVREELVNVLDEHGQLQWEDDPSGATEKAYKIRYLDTDGNITDEANAVHIAAFVGCTYHCG